MFRVFDRTSFPLKAHFKKLMFSPDKQPEVVSKNSASISMLMVAMTKYEEKVRRANVYIVFGLGCMCTQDTKEFPSTTCVSNNPHSFIEFSSH